MTPEGRAAVEGELARHPEARVTRVLRALRVPTSVWYHRPVEQRQKPGPKRKLIAEHVRARIKKLAHTYPWWGFKRIAVIARREGLKIGNERVYRIFQQEGLLQRPRVRAAEVYQAARLFELLPSRPNDLWQADVTYVHVPGHGWRYAVTVIDDYSRYLLACHFTPSYRAADVALALDRSRAEAERHHGPLVKVLYQRLPRLLHELEIAKGDGRYRPLLTSLQRFDLLLLEDWGVAPLTDGNRRDLLELFDDRFNTKSTLITSQLPSDAWHDYLADPTLADAILDRIIHNAHKLRIPGDSLRKTHNLLTQLATTSEA